MLKSIQNQSLLSTKAKSLLFQKTKNATTTIRQSAIHHVNKQQLRSFCKASSPLLKEGPADYGYTDQDTRFDNKLPTIEYAKLMPNRFSAMRHEQILQLCVEGSYEGKIGYNTRELFLIIG